MRAIGLIEGGMLSAHVSDVAIIIILLLLAALKHAFSSCWGCCYWGLLRLRKKPPIHGVGGLSYSDLPLGSFRFKLSR